MSHDTTSVEQFTIHILYYKLQNPPTKPNPAAHLLPSSNPKKQNPPLCLDLVSFFD